MTVFSSFPFRASASDVFAFFLGKDALGKDALGKDAWGKGRLGGAMRPMAAALALLLVVGLLGAGSASAQNGPILQIESQEASVGDSVDVPIEATDLENVGSIGLVITYDPDSLSFPSSPSTDDLIEGAPREDFSANVPEPGELRISWFDDTGETPLTLADDTLLTLTFSRFDGESPVSFDEANSEILGADGSDVAPTYGDGVVTDRLRTLSVGTVSNAPLGDTVTVALSGQDLDAAGSLSLKLGFDPSILEFAELASDNSGMNLQAGAEDGVVTVGGFNSGGTGLGDAFAELGFVFKGGSSELRVRPGTEVTDSTGAAFPVGFEDGEISGVVPSVSIADKATTPKDTAVVSVATTDLTNLGSASLDVRFSPDTLSFVEVADAVDNFGLEAASPEPGLVRIGGFSADGIDPGGVLADLRFAVAESVETPLETTLRVDGSASEITTPRGAAYTATFGAGTLALRPVPVNVNGFAPTSGASGTEVTIYGSGFSPTAGENTVSFGSATATVTASDPDSSALTVEVPSDVVGPVPITVRKNVLEDTSATPFTALQQRTDRRSLRSSDVGLEGLAGGSVALGDLNGNNRIDVIAAGETGDGTPVTRLYTNDGDGTYTQMDANLTGVSNGSVALGDLNGNNRLDVVVAGETSDGTPVTELYTNDGDGTYTQMAAGLTGVTNGSVAIGDLNGDVFLDVAIVGETSDGTPVTRLYANNGDGTYTQMDAGLTDLTNGSVALGDLNGDNRLDIATVGEQADGTPTTRLYSNNGDGTFGQMAELTGVTNGSVALGDLNGDNRLDVATVGEESGGAPVTRLYTNDGSGSFTAMDAGLTNVTGGAVSLGDLNGSNRIDIALSGTDADGNRVLEAYRNVSDGWVSVDRHGPLRVPTRGGLAWSDGDSDGDLDLMAFGAGIGAETAPETRVYENVYPSPTGLAATAGTTQADLSWDDTGGSQLEGYDIYRATAPIDSIGGVSSMEPVGSVGASTTSFTDDNLEGGQTYYYRITATAAIAGETSPPSGQTYAFLYPETVQASASRTFGDASGVTDYHLVALPGQVDRPLGGTLSGEAGTDWQAWWDDGSGTDPFVRFDGSGTFDFRKGRGFWLTSLGEWSVTDSVPTVTLTEDTAATIPVNDGWTIVANPFGKSVDWAAVEAANGGALQPLWDFGGTFTETATFGSAASGTAYYFFNDTGQDSLTVPYPGAPRREEVTKAEGEETPMLALTATPARGEGRAEGPSSTVRMGLAETGGAERAILAPPSRFSRVSLRIEDASAERTLMERRRAAAGEGHTFQLRLASRTEGPVRLSASGLSAIEGKEAALLDPAEGRAHDLQAEEGMTVEVGAEKPRRLKVAVGTKRYVKQEKETVVPSEVTLTSYPNPVRRQGTLEYGLPEASEVTLRVYDVLGRQVATLQQGRKKAGRHTVRLETDQLASGVYFGRLQAGDQTRTQKITVVR